ncbi:MAG: hypothetical protein LRY61_04110 [Burkholderiaceae bacterium]|nr:hypothetical protein [Burkholderiaceae bacterium]
MRNRRLTEPGVVGSWVAMGDFDGYVHALSTQTGELAGRVSVGGGAMFAPVQTTSGGALVQAGDSSVVFIRLN